MQFSWHLAVIVGAALLGLYIFFEHGQKKAGMTHTQLKDADMYRNYAYLLFGVAIVVAVYYYYIQNGMKANMCGGSGHYYGNMGHSRAYMCGKAHMCGAKY